MHFVAEDACVLDPWAAVAADYRRHAPRPADFSLPKPYQVARDNGDSCDQSQGHAAEPAAASGGHDSEVAAAGVAEPVAQGEAGGATRQPRKRSRRRSYQPNEREQQAAARHAAYAPHLAAAAAAVQRWLHASGAATVQQALGVAAEATGWQAVAGSGDGATGAARQDQRHQPLGAPTALPQSRQAEGQPGAAQRPAEPPAAGGQLGAEAAPPAGPDYLAVYEVRHALRPKLQLASAAAASSAGASEAAAAAAVLTAERQPAGGGRGGESCPQGEQQPPPLQQQQAESCNLFDCLITSNRGSSDSSCYKRSGGAGDVHGQERLAYAAGQPVLLPPRSAFLLSDARRLQPLLADAAACGGFHCIVLDPPWENKSAKRSARYPTLPSRNLLALPLRGLMHAGGCLVALWVTNRERHYRFIEEELLPGWGLRHLATWHWLKITDRGQLVGRLDIEHRRPYESLLLCWPAHLPPPASATAPAQAAAAAAAPLPADQQAAGQALLGSAGPSSGFHLLCGRQMVVAAVPPAAHSRKPHLGALLLPLLPPKPRCLEMFARELHSGWTSWGNEVLKHQSLACFQRRG